MQLEDTTIADHVAPIVDFRLKVLANTPRWRPRGDLIAWVTEALVTLWMLSTELAEPRAERFGKLLHG